MEILKEALVNLSLALVALLATFAANYIRARIAADKIETAEAVAASAVLFVQQLYWDLNGEEKLQKAMVRVAAILQQKRINITEYEIRTYIEAAVKAFKAEFAEHW